jgi:hypothetical protein
MINTLSLSYEYIFLNFSVQIQLPTFNGNVSSTSSKGSKTSIPNHSDYVHFQNPKTTIGYALKLGIRKKWSKYNICTKEITSINL